MEQNVTARQCQRAGTLGSITPLISPLLNTLTSGHAPISPISLDPGLPMFPQVMIDEVVRALPLLAIIKPGDQVDEVIPSSPGKLSVLGAVVILTVAAVAVGVSRGHTRTNASYNLFAEFPRVDGLKIGSTVRMSGVAVGSVDALSLEPSSRRVSVRMKINLTVPIPEDSVALIETANLLHGQKYIEIQAGGAEDFLEAGAIFEYTQGAVVLKDVFQAAMESLQQRTSP